MDVAELERQVEYKFAPVPLLAVQAFANTFAFEREEERLLDADAARRWLVESDLATPEVEVSEAGWRRLVCFRDVIRELLDANLTGAAVGDAGAALAELAADHPLPMTVAESGRLALDLTPRATLDGVIAQLIGIVYESQLTGEWERLKVCASDECRWAFYDGSRNRGGTWCQMETCGNRVKNRAYRRRRARSR